MLFDGSTLGAMCTKVNGGVEHGLVTGPDTILNNCINRASDGAMGADGSLDFNLALAVLLADRLRGGLGLADKGELSGCNSNANSNARALEEGPAVKGRHAVIECAG